MARSAHGTRRTSLLPPATPPGRLRFRVGSDCVGFSRPPGISGRFFGPDRDRAARRSLGRAVFVGLAERWPEPRRYGAATTVVSSLRHSREGTCRSLPYPENIGGGSRSS